MEMHDQNPGREDLLLLTHLAYILVCDRPEGVSLLAVITLALSILSRPRSDELGPDKAKREFLKIALSLLL